MTDTLNRRLAAATAMKLESFTNPELASLDISVTGFGRVTTASLGYKPAMKARLIRECGTPFDGESLIAAMSLVIQERIDSGNWS